MNKYGAEATRTIDKVMGKYKRGELTSGKSDKKVTDRKQAIAIGISEARHKGQKVPDEDG